MADMNRTKKATGHRYHDRVMKRRRARIRKVTIFSVAVLALAFGIIFFAGSTKSRSKAGNASEKYFTCYTIQAGDSLWSIAEDHMTEEYSSVNQYIDEVISINGLTSSDIVSGTSIVIPYYEIRNY